MYTKNSRGMEIEKKSFLLSIQVHLLNCLNEYNGIKNLIEQSQQQQQ